MPGRSVAVQRNPHQSKAEQDGGGDADAQIAGCFTVGNQNPQLGDKGVMLAQALFGCGVDELDIVFEAVVEHLIQAVADAGEARQQPAENQQHHHAQHARPKFQHQQHHAGANQRYQRSDGRGQMHFKEIDKLTR